MLGDGVRHRRKSQLVNSMDETENLTTTKMTQPAMTKTRKYLSYVDHVPFARRKKPDSWLIIGAEIVLLCFVMIGSYATYYYVDQLHIPITRLYAKMGVGQAQSLLGQHLLKNADCQEDLDEAIHWMKKAALKGDKISSYNLAIAHLKGHVETDRLEQDEIMQMINYAADHGIVEAEQLRMQCKAKNECPKLTGEMPKYRKMNLVTETI